jgi:hypothetical protein
VVKTALLQSIRESIRSDTQMWSLDSTYRHTNVDAAVCVVRATVAPWTPACPHQSTVGGAPFGVCDHTSFSLNVECNRANSQNLMWQYPRYVWAQAKLIQLLANKPEPFPTAANARLWAQWCIDVQSLISLAVWSTNIRDGRAGKLMPTGRVADITDNAPYLLPLEGPKVAAWRTRMEQAIASGRYGAVTRSYGVNASSQVSVEPLHMPSRVRNLNDVRSGWSKKTGSWAKTPPSPPRSKASFAPIVDFWPQTWAYPLGTRPNSLGVQHPYYTAPRPTSDLDALTYLFQHARERESLEPFSYIERVGARGSYDGSTTQNFTIRAVYATAQGMADYLTALAQDAVIDRTYAKWVSHGIATWTNAVLRIPADIRASVMGNLEQFAAMSVLASEAKADEAFMGMQLGLSSAGAISATIPVVGWAAGLMIAVVQALLTLAHELLKATDSYATGSMSDPICPPPPVIRVIAGGQECNWDDPHRDGLRQEELEREVAAMFGERAAGNLFSLRIPLRVPLVLPGGGAAAGGGGGAAVVGAGALLALFYAMRG